MALGLLASCAQAEATATPPVPTPRSTPTPTPATPPDAAPVADATEGSAPLLVSFANTSAGPVTTWAWDFGDGTSSSEETPTHEYTRAGSYIVRLKVSSRRGSDEATLREIITVTPGPLAGLLSPTPVTLQVEATTLLGATAVDRFGNEISGVELAWTVRSALAAIDRTGLLTAGTEAGTHTRLVKVTATQGEETREATVDVAISPGPLATVEVVPAQVTLAVGESQALTFAAFDEFGNSITDVLAGWTAAGGLGSVGADGLLTAGTRAGAYRGALRVDVVQETFKAAATADVILRPGPLAAIEVTPSSVSVPQGAKQQFAALGMDQYGNEIAGLAFLWNATGGDIDQAGLFTAGSFASSEVRASATSQRRSITGSASIVRPEAGSDGTYVLGDFVVEDGRFELRMGERAYFGYQANQRIPTIPGLIEIVIGPIQVGETISFTRCRQSGSRSSKTHHMTVAALGIDHNLDDGRFGANPPGGVVGIADDPANNCEFTFDAPGVYVIDDSTDPGAHGVARFVVEGEATVAGGVVYTLDEIRVRDTVFELRMGDTAAWGYNANDRVRTDDGATKARNTNDITITINLGDSLVFPDGLTGSGSSTETHFVTIDELGINARIEPGADTNLGLTITPTEAGTFRLYCSAHPDGHGGNVWIVVAGEAPADSSTTYFMNILIAEDGKFELRMGTTSYFGYDAEQRIPTIPGLIEIVIGPIQVGDTIVFDRCRQSGSRSTKPHRLTVEKLGMEIFLSEAEGGGAVGTSDDPTDNCVFGPFTEPGEYIIDDSSDPGAHGVAKFVVEGEAVEPEPEPPAEPDRAVDPVVYTLDEFSLEFNKFELRMGRTTAWGFNAGDRVGSDVNEIVISILVGDSIVLNEGLRNDVPGSFVTHRFSIDALRIDISVFPGTNSLRAGLAITPTEAGEYRIYCSLHPDSHGNEILIVVHDPPEEQPLSLSTHETPEAELEAVSEAVSRMMVQSNLASILNPTAPTVPCPVGTQDMTAFPDATSLVGTADKLADPFGKLYTDGIDPRGDKDGYILIGHDVFADDRQLRLQTYLSFTTSRWCYSVDSDGTVHQHEPSDLRVLDGLDELRTAFSEDDGAARLFLLLSPGSPAALARARWAQRTLEENPEIDLKVYVVWSPMSESDEPLAPPVMELTPDDRVTAYWDVEQLAGRWFGKIFGSGRETDRGFKVAIAFDVYYLFGPEARWGDDPPELLDTEPGLSFLSRLALEKALGNLFPGLV